MNTSQSATAWLPRPTGKQRVELFRSMTHNPQKGPAARFSEFLAAVNILFFAGEATKIQIVEALVKTMHPRDQEAALQSIWSREREGSLGIQPDISILRGRLPDVHHIRAALGICPEGVADPSNPHGKTRLLVIFVGPTTQTRLHAGFLVAASALFHNRRLVDRLTRLESPNDAFHALRQAEGIESRQNPILRSFRNAVDFLRIHYGWEPHQNS